MDRETYELLSRLQKSEFVHDNPLNEVPPAVLGLAKDGFLNEVELKGPSRGTAYVVSEKGRAALESRTLRGRLRRILGFLLTPLGAAVNAIVSSLAGFLLAKLLGQ